jgi:eukaryotic-like serine/threonine-protein kinase
MSVSVGTKLGPYRIEAPIGAGGMGEVYRAKDTRLDRTVAVKVLPNELSSKPGLRQRFEHEARAIASLNHPHICALHDVGQQDGVDFLVMEYLEGETLAARLSHGALKTEQLLRYAIQIADALDKAHRQGFVHRDLKPGNVMLTRAGVKLLDFGLATIARDGKGPGGVISGTDATLTVQPLTGEGMIVGTLPYMAPEQLEGKETDARTDIFAFGAILYEMATGKRAFEGKSQASLIAAILGSEPKPLRTLQPLAPLALERVVQTCLAKDPEERWQNTRDIMRQLEWIAEAKAQPEETLPQRRLTRERLAWSAASLLLIALLTSLPFTIAHLRKAPPMEARPMRFSILPPEKANLGSFAVSPDGRWLAFTAATGGKDQLWVRALDGLMSQALPGTEGASYPFWSPDSRSIAFFAGVKLKKMEVTGGPVQTVCEVTGPRSGGTWNRGGTIVFATGGFGLHQASATGGSSTLIMALTAQELYSSPFFLPDGYHFVEYIWSPRKETRGIYVASLDGTVKQRLLGIDSSAVYAPSLSGDRQLGYLLFLREGALLAQPFDTRQMKLTGEPLPIAEQVGRYAGYWNEVRGNFSVSDNGLLVYDSSVNRRSKQLVWVDRQGKLIRSLGPVGVYIQPCLSPDEKRAVVDRFDDQTGSYDLGMYDVGGGGASQFTFHPASDMFPLWSHDGRRIIWRSNREGPNDFYWKAASGTGQDELLLKSSNTNPKVPTSWSLDGRFLIYYEIAPKTKRDVWVLPLSGDRKPFPFLQTEASEAAGQLSPDGRWMAYTSDESGGPFEIYVRSFPSGGSQKLVSTNGGTGPCWRRDGKELFYYAPDGKLMAVEVKSGPGGGRQEASFEAGPPHALFEFRSGGIVPVCPYTVTTDGQRFLLNTLVDESGGAPLTVVVNWQAELKR